MQTTGLRENATKEMSSVEHWEVSPKDPLRFASSRTIEEQKALRALDRPWTPMLVRTVIVLASVTMAFYSQAQAPPSRADADADLNILLDQISADAASYRLTLSSLGADEAITSQGIGVGPFRNRAEAKALFRVTRKSPGGLLEESRQIIEFNGKRVPEGHAVHLPLTFAGAFGDALEIFFAPALRPCFDFTLAPQLTPDGSQQISFLGHPGSETIPACARTPLGVAGFVRIDPLSHHIRHLERTVPPAVAEPRHIATFASVDYAPTLVGGETFWLPISISAHVGPRQGSSAAEFNAHYSNYHRFTGTVTLLPDVTPIP